MLFRLPARARDEPALRLARGLNLASRDTDGLTAFGTVFRSHRAEASFLVTCIVLGVLACINLTVPP